MTAFSFYPPVQTPPWQERVGVFAVYVFALFAYLGNAGANFGLGLLVIATVADWRRFWEVMQRDLLTRILLWAALAVLISLGLALLNRPLERATQLEAVLDFFWLWLFLCVAWWLRGRQDRVLILLTLALVGFVLGCARAVDESQFAAVLNHERISFKWSATAFGQYSAAALLGLLLMIPRLYHFFQGKRWCWLGIFGMTVLAVLLAQGLIFSQTRTAWLALLIIGVGLALTTNYRRSDWVISRSMSLYGGIFATLIVVILLFNSLIFAERFDFTHDGFVSHVWSGNIHSIDDFAIRERANIMLVGSESWMQKPWFGWGLGAAPHILKEQQARFAPDTNYQDFHNLGLELLAGLGIFGTLPFLVLFGILVYRLRQSARSGCLDRDVYLLLLSLMVLNILCQLTDSRIFSTHGRFYWLLIAGASYTCYLARAGGSALGVQSSNHPDSKTRR
ncbi:MAG: O-antigen ligase family protein [Candidatus Competibacteraceae bacterium]|jgi:O-antigen ligase|nr:O-antigen ligase family protein [Candidatus Competibacteraceae bacterium]